VQLKLRSSASCSEAAPVAFKKQLRLIDVLKRQRIHVRVGPTPRGRLAAHAHLVAHRWRPPDYFRSRKKNSCAHFRLRRRLYRVAQLRSLVLMTLTCAGGLKTSNPRGNRRLVLLASRSEAFQHARYLDNLGPPCTTTEDHHWPLACDLGRPDPILQGSPVVIGARLVPLCIYSVQRHTLQISTVC